MQKFRCLRLFLWDIKPSKKKEDFEQASIKGQKILPTEAENAKSMLRQ